MIALTLPLQPALAQSGQRLEDLIPDSAVADPEGWARQGVPADQGGDVPVTALDADSPLAEAPAFAVPWPDSIELPQIAPLEPDDSVQFADIEDLGAPKPALADATVLRLTRELVVAFPADPAQFPEREDFAARFEGLSRIADLGGSADNIALLSARARADEELLATLLRVYGYYDAQVIRTIGGIQPGEDQASAAGQPEVRFDIIPGPRFRFGAIDLGDLATAPDGAALRRAYEIDPGDPVSSDAIVTEQADLDRFLGETGYAFAEIDAPDLLIDHARTEGDLTMKVRPNGKFAFGEVRSNLPTFLSGKHLATIARFEPGEIYQRSLAEDLRRAIVSTGLVSSVTIAPVKVSDPVGEAPGTVALDVTMSKAKLRTIAGAIGYSSGEGFIAQGSWEHRNLFPPEGMLRVRGIAGTRQQLAGVTFRKNNFGGRDKVLTLDAFASTLSSDAFEAQTASLVGTYERLSTLLFQKPLSWSIGFEAVATRQRPQPVGGVTQPLQTYFIGALPGYAQLDTTDNLLDPKRGFRVGLRLSPETSRTGGSQSYYLSAQLDASTYRPITDTIVLAARVRGGTVVGAPLLDLAPSRRLYAGGGGSVRGYGFQAIGPRDPITGSPTGGRSLVEGAVEARVRTGLLGGAVSVVPFLDAGSVSQSVTPDFDTIRFGAGIGVRYATGFGPMRLDIATPINPGPGDSRIAVYVSLGQAF